MSSSRLDINMNMTPHPLTGDVTFVTGSKAIAQSLKNIVLTSFNERGFEPDFGSGVRGLLFENAGVSTVNAIRDQIKTAVGNYEKDVELVNVDVVWDESDQSYTATMYYTEMNNPQVLSQSISLVGLVR